MMKMAKLALRIVGFVLAFGTFACTVVTVFAVGTGWVDVERYFPNLQLPEPPQIDTSGVENVPGFENRPNIPNFELPDELKPGDSVPLYDLVERRPLTTTIPAPQQLSGAPSVIAANLIYTIIMAIVFGVCVNILENMFADEGHRIQTWLKAYGVDLVLRTLRSIFGWSASRAVRQGCLTLPIIALILAFYGVVFAFLESGTSIFTTGGAWLAVTMAFTVGLVSFSGDIARRIVARFWRADSSFNLYPVGIVVAIITVLLSRGLRITPGIVFGVPGGADIDVPEEKRERREAVLGMASIIATVIIGGLGWLVAGLIIGFIRSPIEERVAANIAGLVTGLQDTALILFLIALETTFFEMLPVAYSAGRSIFKWNKFLWVLIFIPVTFIFNHALLNPQSDFLASFTTSNVRLMWVTLFVLVTVTGWLWFYFNLIDDILQEWVGLKRRSGAGPRY